MKRITSITALVIAMSLLVGCPKKPTIVKEEAMAPVKAPEEATVAAEPNKAEEKVVTEVKEEAPAANEVETKAFLLEDVYFDFDKYDITDKNRDVLKGLGEWLTKNNASIIIEGHCDERGTNEYNLALGDRRTNSVKQYLVNLGVSASMLSTISYGEEKPQCAESDEDCRQKNRRAHFVVKE